MSAERAQAHPEATARAIRRALMRNGLVFIALLSLLGGSTALAFLPLGAWCFPLNLAASALAAAIVACVSMGLDRSPALDRLAALAGFVFVLVMVTIAFCDLYNRV